MLDCGSVGATVYFARRRATQGGGLLVKLDPIFDSAGFPRMIAENQLAAVKIQVGERGNTTRLRPELVRRVLRNSPRSETCRSRWSKPAWRSQSRRRDG